MAGRKKETCRTGEVKLIHGKLHDIPACPLSRGGAVFAVTSSTSRSPQEQALHTEPASGPWLQKMAPFFQAEMTGRRSGSVLESFAMKGHKQRLSLTLITQSMASKNTMPVI